MKFYKWYGLETILSLITLAACASPPEAENDVAKSRGRVEYPVLSPAYAYATIRHTGESRYGTVGTVGAASTSGVFNHSGIGALRLQYEFLNQSDLHEIAGMYLSFGRTALDVVNPDGSDAGDLILTRDGAINSTDFMQSDDVALDALFIRLGKVKTGGTITAKIELTDGNEAKSFVRQEVNSGESYEFPLSSFTGLDLTALKLISIVIEEQHNADKIFNPSAGRIDIENISLIDVNGRPADAASIATLNDRKMLLAIGRRDFESLYRLRDAKTGAVLDRTLFRDLIHYGATGWFLAALPDAVALGWISEEEAVEAALRILRFVDNEELWSNSTTGVIGNSVGILYRYGGIDPAGLNGPLTGTRKIDLDDVNAVEASVIDTALFQFGAATCASGLAKADPEIATRVNSILSRTNWNALVEPDSGQLYLAWKPESGKDFEVPASFGGYWASHDASTPNTIDYFTDEGALAAVLAAGSDPDLASTWYAMFRQKKDGAYVTWPGAWFTYTFFTAIYLPHDLVADNGEAWQLPAIDWRRNARKIFDRYNAILGTGQLADAVELPNNAYLAQGIHECALDTVDHYFGSQAPYSLELALGLGGRVAKQATDDLRDLLRDRPETWDPCFGFLDSYHPDLATFDAPTNMEHAAPLLREEGAWVQQQVWPLNKGAGLLALLNQVRSGTIANTAENHPRIAAGLAAIYGSKGTGK